MILQNNFHSICQDTNEWAREIGSLLITCFCIVTALLLCGVLSSTVLGYRGSGQDESLTCVHVGGLVKERVLWWKMVPICLFWTIWREKNNRNFEDLERSLEDILSSFLHTLYLWTAAYLSLLLISYADFLARFSFSS